MQKTILFLVGLFLMIGCSRNEDDGGSSTGGGKKGYFVKYKINGKEVKDTEEYIPVEREGWYILSRFDENLSGNFGNSYSFDLDGTSFSGTLKVYPLKTGTYTFSDKNGAVNSIHSFTSYLTDWETNDTYYYTGGEKTNFTMTITEVGKNYVKGKFSGNIEGNLLTIYKPKTFKITEGEFYLPVDKED